MRAKEARQQSDWDIGLWFGAFRFCCVGWGGGHPGGAECRSMRIKVTVQHGNPLKMLIDTYAMRFVGRQARRKFFQLLLWRLQKLLTQDVNEN